MSVRFPRTILLGLVVAFAGAAMPSRGQGADPGGDPGRGQPLLTLRGHERWVSAVAFSPDGRRIVSGSEDRSLKIWDAQTGKELLTRGGFKDRVAAVAFSPDGKRVVAGIGNAVIVWEDRR